MGSGTPHVPPSSGQPRGHWQQRRKISPPSGGLATLPTAPGACESVTAGDRAPPGAAGHSQPLLGTEAPALGPTAAGATPLSLLQPCWAARATPSPAGTDQPQPWQ